MRQGKGMATGLTHGGQKLDSPWQSMIVQRYGLTMKVPAKDHVQQSCQLWCLTIFKMPSAFKCRPSHAGWTSIPPSSTTPPQPGQHLQGGSQSAVSFYPTLRPFGPVTTLSLQPATIQGDQPVQNVWLVTGRASQSCSHGCSSPGREFRAT